MEIPVIANKIKISMKGPQNKRHSKSCRVETRYLSAFFDTLAAGEL